jgi:hypothetical protein
MLKKSLRKPSGVAAVSATITSAKLEGVRCAVTGRGGVLRLAAVGMGVTVAAETSAAPTPESASSRAPALRIG